MPYLRGAVLWRRAISRVAKGLHIKIKRLAVVAATVAVLGSSLVGPASAVSIKYSYSGSDYSVNSAGGTLVSACDREQDGRAVRAEYTATGSSTNNSVTNNGDEADCAGGTLSAVVYRHRIIELNPFGASDYGSWVYPS